MTLEWFWCLSVFHSAHGKRWLSWAAARVSNSNPLVVRASQCLFLHCIHTYGSLFGPGLPLALLHSSLDFVRRILILWETIFSRRGIGIDTWALAERVTKITASGKVRQCFCGGSWWEVGGKRREGFGVATCSSVQGGQNLPVPWEEGPWSGSWVH